MKTVTLEYIREIFEGCKNNDYNSICKAGRLVNDIIEGLKDRCRRQNEKIIQNVFI